MKVFLIASLILCLPLLNLAQTSRKAFAYDYNIDDLPNGLRVVTVPTDYPNLVALYIVVQTGSTSLMAVLAAETRARHKDPNRPARNSLDSCVTWFSD